MALAVEIEALDKVPENHRAWYVADGAKFKLDPSLVEIEDTSHLRNALERQKQMVKEAKEASRQALSDALKPYEGIDPEKTRALLSKFDNEEEAVLIAAGKVDEVIGKRMEKQRAQLNKELTAAQQEAVVAKEVANTFKGRVLDNHIRAAAAKVGLHPFAVEDALLRARAMFSLDAQGDAVQLGSDGSPVLGKDGKTPFTPMEWLEAMKETAPHWFPAGASGGGASGSGGSGGSGAKTMRRAVFDALPASEKPAASRAHTIVD